MFSLKVRSVFFSKAFQKFIKENRIVLQGVRYSVASVIPGRADLEVGFQEHCSYGHDSIVFCNTWRLLHDSKLVFSCRQENKKKVSLFIDKDYPFPEVYEILHKTAMMLSSKTIPEFDFSYLTLAELKRLGHDRVVEINTPLLKSSNLQFDDDDDSSPIRLTAMVFSKPSSGPLPGLSASIPLRDPVKEQEQEPLLPYSIKLPFLDKKNNYRTTPV